MLSSLLRPLVLVSVIGCQAEASDPASSAGGSGGSSEFASVDSGSGSASSGTTIDSSVADGSTGPGDMPSFAVLARTDSLGRLEIDVSAHVDPSCESMFGEPPNCVDATWVVELVVESTAPLPMTYVFPDTLIGRIAIYDESCGGTGIFGITPEAATLHLETVDDLEVSGRIEGLVLGLETGPQEPIDVDFVAPRCTD